MCVNNITILKIFTTFKPVKTETVGNGIMS